MRKPFYLLLSLPLATALAFIFPQEKEIAGAQTIQLNAFRCSPDYDPFTSPNSISPLTGWGNYHWKITTSSDSAQFYFNQGISMYYAFHIIEARASFAKMIELDPECGMGKWAFALSAGPNINDFGYIAPPDAVTAAAAAKKLMQNGTPKEQALINAIAIRYSTDTTISQDTLNVRYAAAMKKVFANFPQDADVAALYADALMLLHPWDLYQHDFKPKPWTNEIVQVIEKALKLNPNHPGANHYYIHAVEASATPGRALQSADRLPKLMPDVSHIVHMPSHIYIRTGNYQKGAELNEDAVKGYAKYLKQFPDVAGNAPLYSIHNLHMEATCNQMAGNAEKAMASALKTKEGVPEMFLTTPGPLGHYIQYVHSTPLLTMVRFGKWPEILNAHVPDSVSYANILLHFARGIAFARTDQPRHATNELTSLRVKMNSDEALKQPFTPFNSAYDAIRVAEFILAGVIAEQSGQLEQAIANFEKAVEFEDALIYNEPKDWTLPARHYLGNALLKAKQYAKAEAVYKKDLVINPLNGWSLTGLHQAQLQQNKATDATRTAEQLKKAFPDSNIKRSVY